MIETILNAIDAKFKNKTKNEKMIMTAMPMIVIFFVIYEFETPFVSNLQNSQKQQLMQLDTAKADLEAFVQNAPANINALENKNQTTVAQINKLRIEADTLNSKIVISEVIEEQKKRTANILEATAKLAVASNITINSAKTYVLDANSSKFEPNVKVDLNVSASNFKNLLKFIDKLEETNEPLAISDMSITDDLQAVIKIDIWGRYVK